MHSRRRGSSGSDRPAADDPPEWSDVDAGETGVEKCGVASDEDPSVESIAGLVREVAVEHGRDPPVELVENPRGDDETLVSDFPVDTTRARERLGWAPERDVEETVRELFERRA